MRKRERERPRDGVSLSYELLKKKLVERWTERKRSEKYRKEERGAGVWTRHTKVRK